MPQKFAKELSNSRISWRKLAGLLKKQDWKKLAIWAIVSVLTTGVPASLEAAARKLASDSLSLGFDDLYAQTAPLIWAVTMVAFAGHRGWLSNGGLLPACGLLLLGGWLGHLLQHPGAVQPASALSSEGQGLSILLVFSAINLGLAWLAAYGWGAFLSSIVVGTVLGIGWSKGLESLYRRVTADPSRSPRTQENRESRRAA
ncbi:MAG: hypothetical protein KDA80_02225 [Planctomycetaceae bacterium]|nr:hypothetical protein [Planctomycetaceae bacterium]